MRFTTYSKYHPELADAVNLQGLLDQLSDFLLQSGFAGGSPSFWHDDAPDGERSMESLRQAILQALMESGQLTPDMLKVLRGESTGDPARDKQIEQQLGELLDRIVQRLIEEGYLNATQPPQVPEGYQSMFGPGGQARSAAQQVQFNLRSTNPDELLAQRPGSSLALVTHMGPIKALLCAGLDVPFQTTRRMFLDPATVTVVDWSALPVVRLFNSHAHLGWSNARWLS